jgi:hypothetical protein
MGSRRGRTRVARFGAPLAALAVGAGLLVGCDDVNTVRRPDAPLVLTGDQLPDLVGTAPDDIVAFRWRRDDGVGSWEQMPVQVDQRKVVGFGQQPASNTTPGVDGTVYGSGTSSVTALQYADANTFVGADSNPAFDADDELVFMVADAGGKPRAGEGADPAGVVPGSGVAVQLDDPLGDDKQGWMYLYESPTLDPAAGEDYVDYDFNLTSGDYKTTYKRRTGPNPETSRVVTPNYRIGYSDRWYEDEWRITTGGATGVDVLDGIKNRFALSTCGRSNLTFATAEGAFVANIDGPVRGIRSYVGANSGPLTQRTHKMYRDREDVVTDLRVHSIPGIMGHTDLSAAARGMTYRNSTATGGVAVDGNPDAIGTGLAGWHLTTGAQGSVMEADTLETTTLPAGGTLDDVADGFYLDDDDTTVDQCWGDADFLGAHGTSFVTGIPNTDPALGAAATFRSTTYTRFLPPGATVEQADVWADTVRTPLQVTVGAWPG